MDGLLKTLLKPAKSVLKVGAKIVGIDKKSSPADDTPAITEQVTAILATPPQIDPANLTQKQMLVLGGAGVLAMLLLTGGAKK